MVKEITGNSYYTILKGFSVLGIHHLEKESRKFGKDIEETEYPILVSSQYGWEDGCKDYYSILYPPFKLEKCIFGNVDSLGHVSIECRTSIDISTEKANLIKEKFSILSNWENWITWELLPRIDAIKNIYITKFLLYLENTYGRCGLQEGWERIVRDISNPNTELYSKYNSVLKEIKNTKEESWKKANKLLKKLSSYEFKNKNYKIIKDEKYSIGLYDMKINEWVCSGILLEDFDLPIKSEVEELNNLLLEIEKIDEWEERRKTINYNDMLI